MQQNSRNNYWVGGFAFLLFAAVVLSVMAADPAAPIPAKGPAILLFSLFAWCGVWMIFLSAFKLDPKGAVSYFFVAIKMAGFAVFIIWFGAFTDGKIMGGLPFLPSAFNQVLGKILFGIGGVLSGVSAVVFFVFAIRKLKSNEPVEIRSKHSNAVLSEQIRRKR